MSPGQIVKATVYREEPYGAFLKYDDIDLFVHVFEMSWTEHGLPGNRRGLLNKTLAVKLLKYDDVNRQWSASVKKAHPELNPYPNLLKLGVDTILSGRVFYATSDYASVDLDGGAWGVISGVTVDEKKLKPGDVIKVSILEVDSEEGKLTLVLR